jgi:AcrR family transcriptional regulator
MSPTDRSALDRDEVVRVALHLLDEVGLDGLTMRSLAERLGVKAASLYWHLRDKDELAELLLEAINAEIPEPEPGLPWREQLEHQAWAWRQVLRKHRDAARLAMGRFVMRPQTLRRIEQVLATLRAAGFSDADTASAAYIFSNFVPGFVAEETTGRPAGRPPTQPALAVQGPAVEQARLEVGWAKRLTIRADPSLPDLYVAYGDGQPPEIHASGGVVNLYQTRGRKPSTLVLNATVPWEIHVRGGAAQLSADLRGLPLRAFVIEGGISDLELTAPLPSGTVPIQLSGGASKLTLHRPAEVLVRVAVRGGISHLVFDGKAFPSAGELTVQSPGFDQVPDRYDVRLTGGASRIVVDTAMPPETPAGPDGRDDRPQSLAGLSESQYPNLVSLMGQIMSPSMDDRFRFGVKILLDGLERRLTNR